MPKELQCALCGKFTNKLTKEHVPPRGVFLKPYPSNLITVPACHNCNVGSSKYDQDFQVLLGMNLCNSELLKHKIFLQKRLLVTLNKNEKKHKKLIERMIPLGNGSDYIKWDDHDNYAYEHIITKTIKGLYFKEFEKFLRFSSIKITFHSEITEELGQTLQRFRYSREIGDDFQYKFDYHGKTMLWWFTFYGAFLCGAIINLYSN